MNLRTVMIIIVLALMGCDNLLQDTDESGVDKSGRLPPPFIDVELTFDAIPQQDSAATLRWKIQVLGSPYGGMPFLDISGDSLASHMWLRATLDYFSTTSSNNLDSLWYGPVELMDIIELEFDIAVMSNSAYYDTLTFYADLGYYDTTGSLWNQQLIVPPRHSVTLLAAFTGPGWSRETLADWLNNRDRNDYPTPNTGASFHFNHMTGEYSFRNPGVAGSYIVGYNSLK